MDTDHTDADIEDEDDTEGPAPSNDPTPDHEPAPAGDPIDVVESLTKLETAIAKLNDRITVMDRDFKLGAPTPDDKTDDTDSGITVDDLFE